MSNPFKYFKDKKEIWADVREPKIADYPLNSKWSWGYQNALATYNSRPHFPVSPELDAMLAHEQVIDRTEFDVYTPKANYKCPACKHTFLDKSGHGCMKGYLEADKIVWETLKPIAIPLPKEPKEYTPLNAYMELNPHLDKQDIPMDKEYSDDELLTMATKLLFVIWNRRKINSFLRTTVKVADSDKEYELLFMNLTPPQSPKEEKES